MNMTYPNAIYVPGAPSKVGYGDGKANAVRGVICHSEEGFDNYGREEVQDPAIALSWHFTVRQDGVVEQHYALNAVCWHGGNEPINESFVGVEHEGVTGQPLTAPQLAASVALVRWIAEQGGWAPQRHVTLFEHNEVVQAYSPNAGPTSCPNGRIPWDAYTDSLPTAPQVANPAATGTQVTEEDEMQTTPVVNTDFMALLKDEVMGGVTVGQNVANPKQYLVTLP